MEPESSLLLSQVVSILSHVCASHFLKIHFNIILPSIPWYSNWSLSLRSSHQNYVFTSPLSHTRYMPTQSHYYLFDQPTKFG